MGFTPCFLYRSMVSCCFCAARGSLMLMPLYFSLIFAISRLQHLHLAHRLQIRQLAAGTCAMLIMMSAE